MGYSKLSLYFTLALYLLTLPGLFSLVTRSVKASPTRRTFDLPGPANPTAKTTRQMAGEIMAYFKALNYEVSAAEEVITFRGVMGRSNSQAAFLTFCTFVALGSAGLVLSVLLPEQLGAKAYLLTLLSPYAGIYYWNNAQRDDEVVIKMETSDDEQVTSVFAQGGKEELERFARALELPERGKVFLPGILQQQQPNQRQPTQQQQLTDGIVGGTTSAPEDEAAAVVESAASAPEDEAAAVVESAASAPEDKAAAVVESAASAPEDKAAAVVESAVTSPQDRTDRINS